MHLEASRCANGRQCRRSAGGEDEDVFNHCPVPGPRQHHSSILRIVRSLKYAHRCIPPTHIVRAPAHHTIIPPAWHYLATRPLTKYSFLPVCTYVSLYIKSTQFNPHTLYPHSCVSISSHPVRLPLSLKRRSTRRFVITEKAPIIRAFFWLKAKRLLALSHLRHYDKRTMTLHMGILCAIVKSSRTLVFVSSSSLPSCSLRWAAAGVCDISNSVAKDNSQAQKKTVAESEDYLKITNQQI